MSKTQHSRTPWHVSESGENILDSRGKIDGNLLAITNHCVDAKANARRIVAAVNACEGIPVDALEAGIVGKLLEALNSAHQAFLYYERGNGSPDLAQQMVDLCDRTLHRARTESK